MRQLACSRVLILDPEVYSKASVNTISANTIFEITWFWLLSQIFQFYTIFPQKPLNKDENTDILCTPGSTIFII